MSPRLEASRFMEPGPRRDSEDGPTVHLSGGTARRAMTPHCPCPVGSLRHRRRTRSRRTERRGSPPCHSRLRPPPPTTAAPRAARPHLSDRVSALQGPGRRGRGTRSSLRGPRHVSTDTGRGSPAARHTPRHPPGPTRARPRRPARADRLPGGRARTGALVREQDMAQSHRPLLKDGLPRPGGTRPRARPGEPRSLDCAGPPTCPPPTPR